MVLLRIMFKVQPARSTIERMRHLLLLRRWRDLQVMAMGSQRKVGHNILARPICKRVQTLPCLRRHLRLTVRTLPDRVHNRQDHRGRDSPYHSISISIRNPAPPSVLPPLIGSRQAFRMRKVHFTSVTIRRRQMVTLLAHRRSIPLETCRTRSRQQHTTGRLRSSDTPVIILAVHRENAANP